MPVSCEVCSVYARLLTCTRLVQKTEQPARDRQGVDSYEERTGKGDDVLTSPELNRDTELFGTEVGVADAMRFQVLY